MGVENPLRLGITDSSVSATAPSAIRKMKEQRSQGTNRVTTRHSGFSILMRARSSSTSATNLSRFTPGGNSRARASSAISRSKSVANRSTVACLSIELVSADETVRFESLLDVSDLLGW
jgi:hypothetical protein